MQEGRKLKILSSDDDEGIRALLFSLLTEHGHEVEFAKNSDEVFKNLGRTKYDLLILDVNIPEINGYKIAEKISSNITNRPRILIFTARDIEEERFQFASCGADAILRKGSSCEEIMREIETLFTESPALKMPDGSDITPKAMKQPELRDDTIKKSQNRLNDDLQFCLSRLTQFEDQMTVKNLRYEEFIRDLLREKQRTEKNYLEFKRIEAEVLKLKNWGYAISALAVFALTRSLFQ